MTADADIDSAATSWCSGRAFRVCGTPFFIGRMAFFASTGEYPLGQTLGSHGGGTAGRDEFKIRAGRTDGGRRAGKLGGGFRGLTSAIRGVLFALLCTHGALHDGSRCRPQTTTSTPPRPTTSSATPLIYGSTPVRMLTDGAKTDQAWRRRITSMPSNPHATRAIVDGSGTAVRDTLPKYIP